MFVRRFSAALLLSATALLSTAVPALAHTELKSSNPAKGAALAAPPAQIQLTFSEAVQVEPGAVSVAGPGGEQWTVGQVTVAAQVVTAPVTPVGPAGQYTVSYRVISADGDPVSGKVPFTLTAAVPAPVSAPPSTPSSPPASSAAAPPVSASAATTATATPNAGQSGGSGGIPVWVWIAGAIVIAGAGVLIGVRAGKSKS
ncbi:copper resistance CopC family protein [Kibdelosporangium phytohabitans]|uniref:CopC domain-containing protein n=1 Tax=Kibdelosporangium phytohabitans TaxID=860235 RepID=A0A0N9I961_9PSEU|nr:copper resistance CopC family protein [Kibdelosporangium phytohabitans]ALG15475.1 hypothetical protein AOZ06_41975 [Kibdelosporangium phytohabitans]MBE1464178.1 methionine-rich copper-binding protein CopC [Kibdelosporangium phytohabitans]